MLNRAESGIAPDVPLKVLSVTTLFPSRVQPVHAVFVLNRLRRVAAFCDVRVVVPVPYFPLAWRAREQYARWRGIPREDRVGGLQVYYPRYLSVPRFFKPLDGFTLAFSVWRLARRLRREFDFDLIDSHLAFPDGFGAIILGKVFKRPVTVTLRGHDINLLPTARFPVRKRQIQFALKHADLVIGVADALRRGAVALGADENKTVTISNGVDGEIFYPLPRDEARQRLGLPRGRKIILSVGHLVERKGFHLIVEALGLLRERQAEIPYLVIVGAPGEEGDYSGAIRERVARLGLAEHVRLAGAQPNESLRDWYNAADVFCLASAMEGWANVLLEALACGTPVVATRVWGTPEVITDDRYGLLVERTPEAIARGLHDALTRAWERQVIVDYARSQTWQQVGERVARSFAAAVEKARQPRP
jgi:teichuronic acid biosynthesis glycosyltransferase TuaC